MKKDAFVLHPTIYNSYIPHYLLMDRLGEIRVATFEEDTDIDGIIYKILTEEEVMNLYKERGIDYFLTTHQTNDWNSEAIVECYKKDLLTAIKKLEVNSEW